MKTSKHIKIFNERDSFPDKVADIFHMNAYKDENPAALSRIEPHRHTYHEIIWVRLGTGTHTIDFTDYHFAGPCLFLLHPQHIHTIKKDGPTVGGVLKFTSTFFSAKDMELDNGLINDIFDDVDVMPVISLNSDQANDLNKVFNDLYREYYAVTSVTPQILASYLRIFLFKIYTIKKSSVEGNIFRNPYIIRFRQFRQLLENHFKQHHEPSYFAEQMQITRKTLYNITQQVSGRSPSELIKQRILLEAKRLLHHSGLSVKEIAYQLGYDDSSYFIRFFKQNTKISPLLFKSTYQEL